ncbi:hypothetical protein GCM10007981_18400 [Thermocladium modestius]|uniref:Glycoside hydrolase family 57 N-terminal domain-containing protein n=1 Tax=Thermocladium modestius TaxID=62609 RepID=A0A830GWQ1_9CREN|nr:hypothetical protein [Thermocladium modestius]GGP22418.1 hypothetical protein GCM10007981_18400 [Thermocladium modestius]
MIYITTDKPLYRAGDSAAIRVKVSNEEDRGITVNARITASLNNDRLVSREERISLLRGETKVIETQVDLPGPGVLMANADVDYDGKSTTDSVRAYVLDGGKRIRLALVYHMHQPPWYLPNGAYYMDWAFRYVSDNLLSPFFDGGPYLFHAKLNEKYGEVKINVNLSPSLLHQWVDAVERGYALMDGHVYGVDSIQVKRVGEALDLFRSQAKRGQVEVLTSLYAHTIAGYLAATHGMVDVIDEEVKAGIDVTKNVIGIDPVGVWTPEMAWDMSLLGIYTAAGLHYTVLCGRNHFPGSVGDKGSIYEPYDVDGFTVFFRDQRLSDVLAFENNLFDERHADRMARRILMEAARADGEDPLVVIALDGENFIAMSKTPGLVAAEMNALYSYLDLLQRDGVLSTIRLSEASSAKRRLTFIPTTSWLGGFSKWRGERPEHEQYWIKAIDSYRSIVGAEAALGRRLGTARYALWHAVDSDFWWSDFWSGYMIDEWLRRVREEVANSMSGVRASLEREVIETLANRETSVGIRISNETGAPVRLDVVCCRDAATHVVGPGESVIRVTILPSVAGEYRIPVILSSKGYGYRILYQLLLVRAFP